MTASDNDCVQERLTSRRVDHLPGGSNRNAVLAHSISPHLFFDLLLLGSAY